MSYGYDAIIIGGGVNGGAIAYNLVKRGLKVLVLEKGRLAGEASGAAAGMLGAQAEMDGTGLLYPLAKASRAMFPELSDELRAVGGIDIEFINEGMLKVALNNQEQEDYQRTVRAQQQLGEQTAWLSSKEARLREPALADTVMGAMYLEKDGQVEAPQLTLSFLKAAEALGADIKDQVDVYSFRYSNKKITGVSTSEGDFLSARVVVACGAWSGKLLSQTGLQLQAYPVKGECFSVRTKHPLVTSTIFSDGCYLVPKKGERTIVGATVNPNTFDRQVTVEGISILMERAKKLVPSIADAEWEGAWSGIRPQTGDGLPYLGEHPVYEGLFIATGHFRNGILLSPITGEVMADLVEGKIPRVNLTPFRPDRFAKISLERGEKNGTDH